MAVAGRKPSRIPAVGEQFGSLTVESEAIPQDGKRMVWCACACGGRVWVRVNGLLTGNNRSCGCNRKTSLVKRNTKHGASRRGKRSPEYTTWALMVARCDNPDEPNYGGRGITVCERWRDSFEAFLADMGRKPSLDHSIDRIDVNGSYEPGNCRWATDAEQANNTRRNRRLHHGGETLTLTGWAKRLGLSVSSLHGRLARMSVDEALSLPNQRKN